MSDLRAPLLWTVALVVTATWGFNFVVIAVGVSEVPPLFLAALRFVLAALPAVFFIKRPRVAWGWVLAYGLFLGVGQFGLLFTAIQWGAPAGLSSVILQAQAFFTLLLAAAFLKEKLRWTSLVGLVVAAVGLGGLTWARNPDGAASVPALCLILLLLAALNWAAANVIMRAMGKVDTLSLMVWSSLVPPLPLLGLSWVFEGGPALGGILLSMGPVAWGSVAYLAFLSTLGGYGLWNWLIQKKSASTVAPFSLLVPVFGLLSAWLVLGEALTWVHAIAIALVGCGLGLTLWKPQGKMLPAAR